MNSRRNAWWSSLRRVLSPCGKSSLSLTSMPSSASISFIVSSRPRNPDLCMPSLRKFIASKFFDEAVAALKKIDPSGPLPDRYVQSNFEAMNFLKLGMQRSGFRGRDDTMKLIEALEGMDVKESDDFPQGDKTLRKEDHQAFLRE